MVKKEYIYAFRENARGTALKEKFVKKEDTHEKFIFEKYVRPYLPNGEIGKLIDIGSGEGVYANYFGGNAKEVLLVEPDKYRLKRAVKNTKRLKGKVHAINGTIKDAPSKANSAELISCIHVLQHITEKNMQEILSFISKNLKKDGKFVLAITKKIKIDESEWNLSWNESGKNMWAPIPKALFERAATECLEAVLPVRKIIYENLKKDFTRNRLEIIHSEEYQPKIMGTQKGVFKKLLSVMYSLMPNKVSHGFLKAIRYDLFVDMVIVGKLKD